MKYDDYKQLTLEQQKEWEFKFKEKPSLVSARQMLLDTVVVYCFFLFAYYVNFVADGAVNASLIIFVEQGMWVTNILLWATVIIFVIQLVKYIISEFKEHKFLKQCKMKNRGVVGSIPLTEHSNSNSSEVRAK